MYAITYPSLFAGYRELSHFKSLHTAKKEVVMQAFFVVQKVNV